MVFVVVVVEFVVAVLVVAAVEPFAVVGVEQAVLVVGLAIGSWSPLEVEIVLFVVVVVAVVVVVVVTAWGCWRSWQ